MRERLTNARVFVAVTSLETLRLTFKETANGKLQIFQGNFDTFSTAKLLIHCFILMQSTVQIVLNSNTKLLKSKYDLKFAVFAVSGLP